MNIIKSGKYIPAIFLLLILYSCSTERELARDFVKSKKEVPILLLRTDRIILTNEKLKQIHDFDSLDAKTQDSLWLAKTHYLDSINDIKLLDIMYMRVSKELKSYGFNVFTTDKSNIFDTIQSPKTILNIAQVELTEADYTYRDEQVFFGDLMYYYDHILNAVNLNLWFEFADTASKKPKVLFSSFSVNDQLDGAFILDNVTYKVSYKFKITPFKTEDIYQLIDNSAVKCSNYFYNFLMNNYIRDMLPTSVRFFKHFAYNRYYDFLYYDEEEHFNEINQE
ncbi:MAG: hypothetical protein NTZ33_09035 [Bacteroidetes bacterium]|nr:hypothetical protein [Bacteroidota bacterium]